MDLQLTDREIEEIDSRMNEHMYGHKISNNYSSFVCDDDCRRIALGMFINRVLREKPNAQEVEAGVCVHNKSRSAHPGCYDEDGSVIDA